jgi:hypothetical protein
MSRNDRGVSPLIIILCVALVLAGLIAAYVLLHNPTSSGPASARPAPSAEQRAYFVSLEFSGLHMSAAENFLGTTVTYLDASVTNRGAKTVRSLEVELNFVDVLNQVVLRETAYPITRRSLPLQPGEKRSFRVTFEHMPVDWNQAPPTIKPVYLEF